MNCDNLSSRAKKDNHDRWEKHCQRLKQCLLPIACELTNQTVGQILGSPLMLYSHGNVVLFMMDQMCNKRCHQVVTVSWKLLQCRWRIGNESNDVWMPPLHIINNWSLDSVECEEKSVNPDPSNVIFGVQSPTIGMLCTNVRTVNCQQLCADNFKSQNFQCTWASVVFIVIWIIHFIYLIVERPCFKIEVGIWHVCLLRTRIIHSLGFFVFTNTCRLDTKDNSAWRCHFVLRLYSQRKPQNVKAFSGLTQKQKGQWTLRQ